MCASFVWLALMKNTRQVKSLTGYESRMKTALSEENPPPTTLWPASQSTVNCSEICAETRHGLRLHGDEAGRRTRRSRRLRTRPRGCGRDLVRRKAVELLRVVGHKRALGERHGRVHNCSSGPSESNEEREHRHDERGAESQVLPHLTTSMWLSPP